MGGGPAQWVGGGPAQWVGGGPAKWVGGGPAKVAVNRVLDLGGISASAVMAVDYFLHCEYSHE